MTTSREISKELWERGLRLRTWFYRDENGALTSDNFIGYTPAPMLHELLEIMPDMVSTDEGTCLFFMEKIGKNEYSFFYANHDEIDLAIMEYKGENPADCVAKCLLDLIDNNYVQIKDGKITTGEQDD